MWNANYAGRMYSFQTYSKTPLMLSMLGGIVGDAEVQRAMSEYAKAWSFKHPSPWDYIFFMNKRAQAGPRAGSGTTGCGRPSRSTDRSRTSRPTGAQDDGDRAAGRPDAVAGGAEGAVRGRRSGAEADGEREDDRRQDRDRHLAGRRLVQRQPHVQGGARLRPGGHRRSRSIPGCRFPDRDPSDNVWPKPAPARPRRRHLARAAAASARLRSVSVVDLVVLHEHPEWQKPLFAALGSEAWHSSRSTSRRRRSSTTSRRAHRSTSTRRARALMFAAMRARSRWRWPTCGRWNVSGRASSTAPTCSRWS